MLPHALLFDLDGTIANTERYWYDGELAVLEPLGVEWNYQEAQRYIGASLEWSARDIVQRYSLSMSADDFRDALVEAVHDIAARERTQWLPGVLDTFRLARELSIPAALVTMSHRPLADVVIEDAPQGTFEVVVTGEEVQRGKPAPDAYLLAAQRLGIDVRHALVFEDSPPGVLAGIRSGAQVVAIELGASVPHYRGLIRRESMAGIDEETLRAYLAQSRPREEMLEKNV